MLLKALISPNKTYDKIIIRRNRDDVELMLFRNEFDVYPEKKITYFRTIHQAQRWAEEVYNDGIMNWESTTFGIETKKFLLYMLSLAIKKLQQYWNGTLSFLATLTKFIPGTKKFRKRYIEKLITTRKAQVTKFEKLETLSPEKKKNLTTVLRHRESPIIQANLILQTISDIEAAIAGIIIFFLLFGGSVLLMNRLLGTNWSIGVGLISFFSIWLWVWIWSLLSKIDSFLNNFFDTFLLGKIIGIFPILFTIGAPIYAYIYTSLMRSYLQNIWIAGLFCGAFTFSVVLVYIAGFIGISDLLLEPLLKRRLQTLHPESVLVNNILELLSMVEKNPDKWKNIKFKQNLLLRLENIAAHLEKNILYKIKYRDNFIKVWVKTEIQKVSSAIRETKKMILLPEQQSRNTFLNKTAHLLEVALLGTWGELPKTEKPQEISFLQNFSINLSFIVRTAISAILPFSLWVVFQMSPYAIKNPVSDYVTIGVVIWGILSVLAAFDPSYSSKISAIKDVSQIFPLSLTKKE